MINNLVCISIATHKKIAVDRMNKEKEGIDKRQKIQDLLHLQKKKRYVIIACKKLSDLIFVRNSIRKKHTLKVRMEQ